MPSYDNVVLLGAIQRLAQELKVVRARVETVYEMLQRIERRGLRIDLDSFSDYDEDDEEGESESEQSAESAPF